MRTFVTSTDTGAGCLKGSGGFAPPSRAWAALAIAPDEPGALLAAAKQSLDSAAAAGVVELWFDPDPRGQVALLATLCSLRDEPGFTVVPVPFPIGWQWAPRVLRKAPPPIAVDATHLVFAAGAWAARWAETPEAWQALANHPDSACLPRFPAARTRFLAELPDRSGLSATERGTLARIARGKRSVHDLVSVRSHAMDVASGTEARLAVLAGLVADGIVTASGPVDGWSWTLPPSDREARLATRLGLTSAGRRVLAGRSDGSGPRHRGWAASWRFDPASEALWSVS